jgi:hypothetical protein
MIRARVLIFLCLAAAAAALAGTATAGGPGKSAPFRIVSATPTGACSSGSQSFTFQTLVALRNPEKSPSTVLAANWWVKAGHHYLVQASATSDGGLLGAVLAGRASSTFNVTVVGNVACNVKGPSFLCLQLAVSKHDPKHGKDEKYAKHGKGKGERWHVVCRKFKTGGGPVTVPAGTIGLLGLTLVLGAALVLAQVRSRRKRGTRAVDVA